MKKIHKIAAAWMVGSTCLLSISQGYAQTKTYKASLPPVTTSGYYSIELDNRLVGNAKTDLSNLRIFKQGQEEAIEVPYFIRAVQPTSKETKMVEYPLMDRVERDSINRFVIHNPEEKKSTDFYVTINKADVAITASVRGSNNKKDWFIVKQKTPIYTYTSSEREEETLFVSIPEGRYPYYEMELINNQSTPLKVNKVSTVVGTKTYGQFSPMLLQYDKSITDSKEKKTIVSFVPQELNYKLNKVVLEVESPRDYYRKAVLRDSVTKVAVPLVLSSKQRNEWILDDVLVRNPYLEIENGNNIPLTIQSVQLYSLTRFATAYLEANESYDIEVNSATKGSPEYDITYFKNDIPSNLPLVQTQEFKVVTAVKEEANDEQSNRDRLNKILWAVLIVVGLFIVYICYKTFQKLEK
ncbi:MAG: hypothetical protein LBI32_00850 [Myroides odoratus]|jgi:hypothetical protein|nr:hypothetical protein [Myroides odoratus]